MGNNEHETSDEQDVVPYGWSSWVSKPGLGLRDLVVLKEPDIFKIVSSDGESIALTEWGLCDSWEPLVGAALSQHEWAPPQAWWK